MLRHWTSCVKKSEFFHDASALVLMTGYICRAGEAAALQMLRRDHPEARRVQPTMRSAQANASALRVTIAEYEDLLNISAGESWTPDSDMYKKTKVYITERRYRLALDHLERLVVQRVFELEKEGLIDTGKCCIVCILNVASISSFRI